MPRMRRFICATPGAGDSRSAPNPNWSKSIWCAAPAWLRSQIAKWSTRCRKKTCFRCLGISVLLVDDEYPWPGAPSWHHGPGGIIGVAAASSLRVEVDNLEHIAALWDPASAPAVYAMPDENAQYPNCDLPSEFFARLGEEQREIFFRVWDILQRHLRDIFFNPQGDG